MLGCSDARTLELAWMCLVRFVGRFVIFFTQLIRYVPNCESREVQSEEGNRWHDTNVSWAHMSSFGLRCDALPVFFSLLNTCSLHHHYMASFISKYFVLKCRNKAATTHWNITRSPALLSRARAHIQAHTQTRLLGLLYPDASSRPIPRTVGCK